MGSGPGARGPVGVLITSVAALRRKRRRFGDGETAALGASWLARAHGAQEHRFGGVPGHQSSTGPSGQPEQEGGAAAGGPDHIWSGLGRTGQGGGPNLQAPPTPVSQRRATGLGRAGLAPVGVGSLPMDGGRGVPATRFDRAMKWHSPHSPLAMNIFAHK